MTRLIASSIVALLLTGTAQAGDSGFKPRTTISELGNGATQDRAPSQSMLAQIDLAKGISRPNSKGPLKTPGRGFMPPVLDRPLSSTMMSLTN